MKKQKAPFQMKSDERRRLHERILAVLHMGDPAQRPDVLPRAGEGYAPNARIMIVCPVCGRRAWIAPVMHPYWLRDRAGQIHFVCGQACHGDS